MIYFKNENRLAIILKTLKDKGSVTVDFFTNKLGVSTKSIKNDIKELNWLLKGHAIIDNKNSKYILYILDSSSIEKIYVDICKNEATFNLSENRIIYIFYKLINSEKAYLTDDFAEEMNVGRTTVVNDLKKLRHIIETYQIKIVGKANTGLYLMANELNIRKYILEKVFDNFYDQSFLDKDVFQLIEKNCLENNLSVHTINELTKYIIVTIDRVLNGYILDKIDKKYENIINTSAFIFIDKLLDKLEDKLYIKLSKNDRIFITIAILGMRTSINANYDKKLAFTNESISLVNDIFKLIKNKMNIVISPNDLYEDFICHISFMLNRFKYGIRINNNVLHEIKDKCKVEYKMGELVKELIKEKFNEDITEDEIGFLAMYFRVFILENNSETNKIKNIAIICSTGRVTARLIEAQLKEIINFKTNIYTLCANEINNDIVNKYGLILSTIKLDLRTSIPIIYLKEIFDKEELKKKIDRIKFGFEVNNLTFKGIDSVLLNLLKEDQFFILDNNHSYMENINNMIDNLYNNGYVDIGFKERIYNRETKSSMLFNNNIALPHAVNYKGDRLILSLGIIKGASSDFKIIFLFALPKNINNDDSILLELYNEILVIANNHKVAQEISKVKNYKELMLYFLKENTSFL